MVFTLRKPQYRQKDLISKSRVSSWTFLSSNTKQKSQMPTLMLFETRRITSKPNLMKILSHRSQYCLLRINILCCSLYCFFLLSFHFRLVCRLPKLNVLHWVSQLHSYKVLLQRRQRQTRHVSNFVFDLIWGHSNRVPTQPGKPGK